MTREEWGWFETARALSKIDPDHSATLLLPNVSKLLSEPATVPHRFPKRILQLFALEIAANLGPPAEQCLPHLLSLTNAPDEMIKRAANKAVKRIGVESRSSRATPTNDISNDIPK